MRENHSHFLLPLLVIFLTGAGRPSWRKFHYWDGRSSSTCTHFTLLETVRKQPEWKVGSTNLYAVFNLSSIGRVSVSALTGSGRVEIEGSPSNERHSSVLLTAPQTDSPSAIRSLMCCSRQLLQLSPATNSCQYDNSTYTLFTFELFTFSCCTFATGWSAKKLVGPFLIPPEMYALSYFFQPSSLKEVRYQKRVDFDDELVEYCARPAHVHTKMSDPRPISADQTVTILQFRTFPNESIR